MAIVFELNWDGDGTEGYPNHDSGRSQSEVERLIGSVVLDAPSSTLAVWLQMGGVDVIVEKGIHQRTDSTGDHRAHIRVKVSGTRYHINLISSQHGSGSFVWKVESVT